MTLMGGADGGCGGCCECQGIHCLLPHPGHSCRALGLTALGTLLVRDDRPVWLIEARTAEGPKYWTGRSGSPRTHHAFDRDVNWAVRFARKEDAEQVRCWVLDESTSSLCASIEHLWSTLTPTVPETSNQAPLTEIGSVPSEAQE